MKFEAHTKHNGFFKIQMHCIIINLKKIKILLDTASDMVQARVGGESKSEGEGKIPEKRRSVGSAGRYSPVRDTRTIA